MNNKDFEPIRVRIMQEAYELADRNDAEGYNAIKVMCGDVQKMLSPQRKPLTDEEIEDIWKQAISQDNRRNAHLSNQPFVHIARAIEAAHNIKE